MFGTFHITTKAEMCHRKLDELMAICMEDCKEKGLNDDSVDEAMRMVAHNHLCDVIPELAHLIDLRIIHIGMPDDYEPENLLGSFTEDGPRVASSLMPGNLYTFVLLRGLEMPRTDINWVGLKEYSGLRGHYCEVEAPFPTIISADEIPTFMVDEYRLDELN